MRVFTSDQIREAESLAIKSGMNEYRLMENAGAAVAKVIKNEYALHKVNPSRMMNIVVVCGKGNNGGDGFVIARKLFEVGHNIKIILASGPPKSQTAEEMMSRTDGIKIYNAQDNYSVCMRLISRADFIIDAIFGFGFKGEPDNEIKNVIFEINRSDSEVISVDLPSGVYCDGEGVSSAAVKADLTITISTYKFAHITYPSEDYCGRVRVVDIGIPEECFLSNESDIYIIDQELVKGLMPKRDPKGNKGTFGKLISVCGSRNMPGAAILSADGALRSGVGLVTAVFPDAAYSAISSHLVETILCPSASDERGYFAIDALPEILELLKKASACLVGCGIGMTDDVCDIVYEIIKNAQCPIIIDADGINSVALNIDILKAAKAPIVMTPHPGEMSRLLGCSIEEIQTSRIEKATQFAQDYGVTLVLKGANTVVASPKAAYINLTGNSGMAKGGSGDLLAGMTASFVAQGMEPFYAALCAVYIHGRAGDIVKLELSERGMIPTDMLQILPSLLSEYEKQGDD